MEANVFLPALLSVNHCFNASVFFKKFNDLFLNCF